MMLQYGCKNNQNNNDNTNKNKKKREKKKKEDSTFIAGRHSQSRSHSLRSPTMKKEKWQGPHETIKIGKEQKNRGIIPWPPVTPVKTGA